MLAHEAIENALPKSVDSCDAPPRQRLNRVIRLFPIFGLRVIPSPANSSVAVALVAKQKSIQTYEWAPSAYLQFENLRTMSVLHSDLPRENEGFS
jgi:hypothetical protein